MFGVTFTNAGSPSVRSNVTVFVEPAFPWRSRMHVAVASRNCPKRIPPTERSVMWRRYVSPSVA